MRALQRLLRERFGVTEQELDKALAFQQRQGGQLEQILVNLGVLSVEMLQPLYAELLSLPVAEQGSVDGWSVEPLADAPFAVTRLIALRWFPQPVAGGWTMFTDQPLQPEAHELLATAGIAPGLQLISSEQAEALRRRWQAADEQEQDGSGLSSLEEDRLRELASEAPVVNLLNNLIARALRMRASDMHIEPITGRGRVRFRIDGVLQEAESVSSAMLLPLITRLKILSSMDIAERRRPQDGKIEMRISAIDLDIRVSALPLADGESVVLRFLRKDALRYELADLGLSSDIENWILEDLTVTSGVVLLTGPTGSGKTTTLYTFLSRLNLPGVKIITLEDPVEYQLPGINQVQVQPAIGFDFAAGLRSVVRQDPDIIMVGEIRDRETAAVAMQSALTGHLVFSTVHTNDAPSAYTRLLELGVEDYLLNASLRAIVAQRLARRLCHHCARPHHDASSLMARHDLQQLAERYQLVAPQLLEPVGCPECANTGYRGRVAVIEYLRCDDAIRQLPKDSQFLGAVRAEMHQRGYRTLVEDGMLKALQGVTSIAEVMRVAG